jgi:hypothetical protein
MSEDKIVEEALELAKEAKKPGTFNIINVLKDRAFPVEQVNVYLDEQAAYDAAKLQEQIDELAKSSAQQDIDSAQKLADERDVIISKLEQSRYVFHITGISEGKRNELQDECLEKFPMEYDENKNPFTGEVLKQEKEDKGRDRYFTNALWVASISKIVDNEGNEQTSLKMDDVESLRELLPLAASGAITQSIEKLRISTAIFMASVDEDFLAKS